MGPLERQVIQDLLRVNAAGYIFHREKSNLEFKEKFNFAGLAEYLKDFAAFANNKGGYLVFGVENSPRIPSGLDAASLSMFQRIDQEMISGALNETFSPAIEWEQIDIEIDNRNFGIFYIYESKIKPVIAKKDEGRDQIIKNGEIYYRYAGRTQKIEYAELENIIQTRIAATNHEWLELMNKIGKVGPSNAAILDTERGVIEKNPANVLVLDKDLIKDIKFVREGDFSQKEGASTLKLIGSVQPVDQVEVTKVLRENITDLYPYSYTEMIDILRSNIENVSLGKINEIIKDNNLKNDRRYCAYNFRNKQQEERFKDEGHIPVTTPTLYNDAAVEFIASQLIN